MLENSNSDVHCQQLFAILLHYLTPERDLAALAYIIHDDRGVIETGTGTEITPRAGSANFGGATPGRNLTHVF